MLLLKFIWKVYLTKLWTVSLQILGSDAITTIGSLSNINSHSKCMCTKIGCKDLNKFISCIGGNVIGIDGF